MSAPDLSTQLAQQAEFATRIITLGHRAGLKPIQSLDYALKGLIPDAWVAGAPAQPPDMLAGIRSDLAEMAAGIAERLDGLERRLTTNWPIHVDPERPVLPPLWDQEKIARAGGPSPAEQVRKWREAIAAYEAEMMARARPCSAASIEPPSTGPFLDEPGTEGVAKPVDAAGGDDAPVTTGRPVEGPDAPTVAGRAHRKAQASTSVQSSGAGEEVAAPIDPAPVARADDNKRLPSVEILLGKMSGEALRCTVPAWTAPMLEALIDGPMTSAELVEIGAANSMDLVRRIARQLNAILEPIGFGIVSEARRSEKGYKSPYLYKLVEIGADASPAPAAVADDAPVFGRQAFDPLVSEADAEKIAEAIDAAPVLPSPLPPRPLDVKRTAPLPPAAPPAPPQAAPEPATGHVIGVDVSTLMIAGPTGQPYRLNGIGIARALDALKTGQLFGLTHIASKCGKGVKAQQARDWLRYEADRLRKIGVGIMFLGDNARLIAEPRP
jgi:hypothetical protein